MKTIMILGGGPNQLPLLEAARARGYRIVLCDYQANNPGRVYADEFYRVSTLDVEAVVQTARAHRPDGIITNSEPAMQVAAYAAQALGLPCNPPEMIAALSRKDLFRALLTEKGVPVPRVRYADTPEDAQTALYTLRLPVMVKPVDSSGSRGVTKLTDGENLPTAFAHAVEFSRMGRVILEEFIDSSHDFMIGGDLFVADGQVIFWGLMNSMRDMQVNPFVPTGTSFPTLLDRERVDTLKTRVQTLLSALGIRFGAFNLEMMFGTDGELYFIELNPRNGGNHIPELLRAGTGFDVFDATVAAAVGDHVPLPPGQAPMYQSTYVVHSARNGILRRVTVDAALAPLVTEYCPECRQGDRVERFENADKRIGILHLRFENRTQMSDILSHIDQMVNVELEGRYEASGTCHDMGGD